MGGVLPRLPLRALGLVLAAACAGPACSPAAQERLRRHTYPPSFHYITAEQLQSTMWQLADHANRLDALMREGPPRDQELRAQVIEQLAQMGRAAAALGPGHWPSNHPRVSRNVEHFRREVEAARRAAEVDPPSYFLAGSVSGACVHCHAGE